MQISVLVIYTADVCEKQTKDMLDVGAVKLQLKQTFLSNLDSNEISNRLRKKVKEGIRLTEEELMQFIILPLTYEGMDEKKNSIKELFELSKNLDQETQLFLLSGVLVFTDKVIDEKVAKQIKEWLRMTKVAKLFEEEKLEAIEETAKETAKETAREMLKDGFDVEKIVKYVKELSIKDIEQLKNELERL